MRYAVFFLSFYLFSCNTANKVAPQVSTNPINEQTSSLNSTDSTSNALLIKMSKSNYLSSEKNKGEGINGNFNNNKKVVFKNPGKDSFGLHLTKTVTNKALDKAKDKAKDKGIDVLLDALEPKPNEKLAESKTLSGISKAEAMLLTKENFLTKYQLLHKLSELYAVGDFLYTIYKTVYISSSGTNSRSSELLHGKQVKK